MAEAASAAAGESSNETGENESGAMYRNLNQQILAAVC
jgi:hypothetical protein